MDETAERTNGAEVLKRDALGRVTLSSSQREALVDEFERSGLKGAEFARLVGVNYGTFAYWVQKRRHQRGDYQGMKVAQPSALRWVEAVPVGLGGVAVAGSRSLEVRLGGGVSFLVQDPAQASLAASLIKALQLQSTASLC